MRFNFAKFLYLVIIWGALSRLSPLAAQEYYRFPVTREGIYRLPANELNALGLGSLEDIAIFGHQGVLPQKIESNSTQLTEIPSAIIDGNLIVYLSGPQQVRWENGAFQVENHTYSDTLFYLIGRKIQGHKIEQISNSTTSNRQGLLYQVQTFFWEQENLLNSGRNWYSRPIFGGQNFNFSFTPPQGNSGDFLLHVGAMGQALAENRLNINVNGQNVQQITIPAVPPGIYDIKGREGFASTNFTANPQNTVQVRIRYESGDFNGAGFMKHALLASKFDVGRLTDGIYYNLGNSPQTIQAVTGKTYWKISPNQSVTAHMGTFDINPGERLAVFSATTSAQSIRNLERINLSLREARSDAELIIITAPLLLNQANRLAQHKRETGIPTQVVLVNDIYLSFGYGNRDITAIRNFLAFHFQQTGKLRNVLFFGKGTYDYKGILGGRPNLVPTYTSRNSLNPLTTYSSDDYFGFLELGQGDWEESSNGDEPLSIGIGRIPAINVREAREAVDKIIAYERNGPEISGSWKTNIAFLADDGDNNIHLNDSESHSDYLQEIHPEFSIKKLYLDRYEQTGNPPQQQSLQAREALNSAIRDGLLILNYIGHGNETTLSAERIFTVSDLNQWPQNPLLPLIVTATCEFGRHDSPLSRSGAEELLFAEKKGAIGLLTTGRPVFASVNFRINRAFIEHIFKREDGRLPDLGEVYKTTKNLSLNGPFNRNFSLLGDPSLRLLAPDLSVGNIIWEEKDTSTLLDTLSGGRPLKLQASIMDPLTQASQLGFNGTFELRIFDESEAVETLGDESAKTSFREENNLLFQGTGKITDGKLTTEVFLPVNLGERYRKTTVRIYAQTENGEKEAVGFRSLWVGGKTASPMDNEGPKIEAKWGDQQESERKIFPSTQVPVIFLLSDESGINVRNSQPSQDILLTVNGEATQVLNKLYRAKGNNFKKGQIETTLRGLREGMNTLTLEVWDNAGNRTSKSWTIEVSGSLRLQVEDLLVFPNPATEKSSFRLIHNRPGENLLLNLAVYSVDGSKIFEEQRRYVEAPRIIRDLEWIFFHHKTKYPTKGTYIYNLELTSESDGTSDRKSGKINIQ